MSKENKYGLSTETLQKALEYMKSEGYIPQDYTTDNLIDYTRSAVEDNDFMVTRKITQWTSHLEK